MADGVNEQILQKAREFHVQCGNDSVNAQVEAFLNSPKPETAYKLFRALLELQHKGDNYKAFLEDLAKAELTSIYRRQRDHVVHSCLVYCVGIYLYMSFPVLRTALEIEMRRSESEAGDENPRYSNGTEKGEFSFRWRLAALCHDIGYPFEMSGRTRKGLLRYLKVTNASLRKLRRYNSGICRLKLSTRTWFDQLNHLPFAKGTALGLLEEAAGADALDLPWYWCRSGYCRNGPDHGIASAVLIYRMADLLYKFHNRGNIALTTRSMWYRRWLTTSTAHALAPIAYHNFEPTAADRQALERLTASRPLIGLLRMADALQDWDRKYFHEDREPGLEPVLATEVYFDPDPATSSLTMHVTGKQAIKSVNRIRDGLRMLQGFPVKAYAVKMCDPGVQ